MRVGLRYSFPMQYEPPQRDGSYAVVECLTPGRKFFPLLTIPLPQLINVDARTQAHEKLLLILSTDAVMSNWVQQEVEAALYKEVITGKEILFPIRLDNTVWKVRLSGLNACASVTLATSPAGKTTQPTNRLSLYCCDTSKSPNLQLRSIVRIEDKCGSSATLVKRA